MLLLIANHGGHQIMKIMIANKSVTGCDRILLGFADFPNVYVWLQFASFNKQHGELFDRTLSTFIVC